jgi:hypothetical protein
MTKPVMLNNVDHEELRVAVRHGAAFGDAVNQVLVFPTEFEALQRHYPIFIRRHDSGQFYPIVLLGLDHDENLFLDDHGWQAHLYIPAAQRRGPFTLAPKSAEADTDEPAVQLDLDDPRVGAEDGEPLFLRHGGNAPYLEHVTAVLQTIQHGREAIQPMFAALEALDLIRPVEVEITLDGGDNYVVPDLHTIDEDRLATLVGEQLERFHHSGFLRAAMMAASSVDNVNQLIARKQRKAGR